MGTSLEACSSSFPISEEGKRYCASKKYESVPCLLIVHCYSSAPQGLSLGNVKPGEREQDLKVRDVTKRVVKGQMEEESNGGGDWKVGNSVRG